MNYRHDIPSNFFSHGRKEKSEGAKSGEYGAREALFISLRARKLIDTFAVCGQAGIEKNKKKFQEFYFTQSSSTALVLNPPR
jgi:hypothetical protein